MQMENIIWLLYYQAMEKIIHPIPPVYDNSSEILILGSFPSVKSREEGFFYGHRMNRFWKVMESLFSVKHLATIEEKKDFLLSHHIALWDVIGECSIEGSDDSSIKDAKPNDISKLIGQSKVNMIFTNGNAASKLYRSLLLPSVGIDDICLPSTSPRNASYSLEKLIGRWSIILNYLD